MTFLRRLLTFAIVIGLAAATLADEPVSQRPFKLERLQGRVTWLSDALTRRFGIKQVPEAAERMLALETRDGKLHPLVEDVRGRAFRRDPRLREIDVELLVRRYERAPVDQVIQVFELADDGKYEIDYWCEICSIAMFELKDCECCQGPIELRRRKVAESQKGS